MLKAMNTHSTNWNKGKNKLVIPLFFKEGIGEITKSLNRLEVFK